MSDGSHCVFSKDNKATSIPANRVSLPKRPAATETRKDRRWRFMGRREELLKTVESLRWDLGDHFHDHTVEAIYAEEARISSGPAILSDHAGRLRFAW